MRYENYHKHSHKGNIKSLDVIVKMEDYCKRAVELGHKHIFTTEHGYQGDVHEAVTLGKKYNLNVICGVEAYYVPNRFEKDRSNYHIIIIAKNTNGFKQINKIMSEANTSGYYYKPRIDNELLFSLNPNDVYVTTACVGGIIRDSFKDRIQLLKRLKQHFGENLFLEVQCHNDPVQIEHNKMVLHYSKTLQIKLIHANDSHYILPEDAKYRDMFLRAKGITYEDESGFLLDYPTSDTIIERYKHQGVLTEEQVLEALNNTLVFDNCKPLTIYDNVKLPKISKDSVNEFKQLINEGWKREREFIPKERWKEYLDAIKYECQIVFDTNLMDYFILDHKVVKLAVEKYGGVITRTGRGSAPSFYINKLLGLTDIDRLNCPITLYPTRFISTTRILETRSLADIDLNMADREPFIKATQEILGDDGIHWLMAFKPLQDSSAFRLFCKAKGMHIDEYNEVAKDLEQYIEHPQWKDIIEESKVFKGVVESVAPSPCSFLLLDQPISEEVGIMKVGDEYCANLDGYNCDVYKYLKNDYLSVTVWKIISDTCKLANIPIPTIRELNDLLDEKTYSMYELELTCTLNQADSDFATDLVRRYKPKTVGEMSAFVAAIRPGFASLLDNFIERKPYSTGVKKLDDLLSDSFCYLTYQESIMKFLVWLGMEESKTYDIIKKISKKKFNPQELIELKKQLKQGWIKQVGTEEHFEETWQVVEDAARYSFNASHSLSVGLDSLYGAYLKSHYPLEYYTVCFNEYADNIEKTTRLEEEIKYFGIKLESPKYGYSRGNCFFDRETNTIYKGIGSIKYLNCQIGEEFYTISMDKTRILSFYDLLKEIDFVNSRQLEILIKIGYFSSFGKTSKLLQIAEIKNKYYGKKVFKNDGTFYFEIIKKFAKKVTDKQAREVDVDGLINFLISEIPDVDIPIKELIESEHKYTGTAYSTNEQYNKKASIILDIDTKYTPTLTLYQICSGKTVEVKVSKQYFESHYVELYDEINILSTKKKQRQRKVDGKWEKIDEWYFYIEYEKCN